MPLLAGSGCEWLVATWFAGLGCVRFGAARAVRFALRPEDLRGGSSCQHPAQRFEGDLGALKRAFDRPLKQVLEVRAKHEGRADRLGDRRKLGDWSLALVLLEACD